MAMNINLQMAMNICQQKLWDSADRYAAPLVLSFN
jgi:hypothetical protein